MKEGQEFHIRRTPFEENGFRLNFQFKEDWKSFFLSLSPKLIFIEDEDYNFDYRFVGKLGISLELGYMHIWFEDEKFSDEKATEIIREFYNVLKQRFGEDIEYIKS